MDRPIRVWLGLGGAIGAVTAALTILMRGAAVATDIGYVLEAGLLAVAFLAGRRARKDGRRGGWIGALVGGIGGAISGLGYFAITLPVSDFHASTYNGVHRSAAALAGLANSTPEHVAEMIQLALVLAVFGALTGTIGGGAGRAPSPGGTA